MNNWTLHQAIKTLTEDEELFIRYDNDEYTFTLTNEDKSRLCYQNDIHILTKGIWVDCDKICFMKTRTRSVDL